MKEYPIYYGYFKIYPKCRMAQHQANGNWVYWDNPTNTIHGINIPEQNFKDLIIWLNSQQAVHCGCG